MNVIFLVLYASISGMNLISSMYMQHSLNDELGLPSTNNNIIYSPLFSGGLSCPVRKKPLFSEGFLSLMTMLEKLYDSTLQVIYNHLEISKYRFTPIRFHITTLEFV